MYFYLLYVLINFYGNNLFHIKKIINVFTTILSYVYIFAPHDDSLGLKVCGSCRIFLKEYILFWVMLQELTLFLSQDDCSSYWQIFLLLILGLVVGVTPGTLVSPYQEIMPRVSTILQGLSPGSGFTTDLDPCLTLTI